MPKHVLSLGVSAAALAILGLLAACGHQNSPESEAQETPASTGRLLYAAYSQQNVGSMPVNIVLSADGSSAFTTDIGYRQSLHSIRTSDGVSVASLEYFNRRPQAQAGEASAASQPENPNKTIGLYYGLAVSGQILYAAQGAHDSILVIDIAPDGRLSPRGAIATKSGDFPAGLAVDGDGKLYVANQAADDKSQDPTAATASVAIYDPADGRELGRYWFKDSYSGTSNFPLALAASHDGSRLYVAAERDNAVYVLDTHDPAHPALAATIATGAHPTALLLRTDQQRLYVTNADSDTLAIVDTGSDQVIQTILLRPPTAQDLPGCTPTGVAVSHDGQTAYVTVADMNAVAVVDLGAASVRGYLPTGWYPTSLALAPDGQRLLVTAVKGSKPQVPNMKANARGVRGESPLNVYEGVVQVVPIAEDLKETTATVLANCRLSKPPADQANPLQDISRQSGGIEHVIYIIKENRTYDQTLGDLPQANGDASLCLFGRGNTPNQHALAERFVLLDNLYACGEVSGDGWCWSTQSMANAYVARNVPYHYSQRGRKFDFEGQNNGYPTGGMPATGPDGQPLATNPSLRDGAKPIPDVAEAGGGYIWDLCAKSGVSFRNYGFFGYFSDEEAGVPGGPDNYPTARGLQPAGHDLAGLTDIDYRRFDMDYPDSDAPALLAMQTGDSAYLYDLKAYGKFASVSRFSEFDREFKLMLAKDPTGGSVPNLMFLRVPTDHTVGGRSGKHSPSGYLADNDYGVGQIVQAISQSPIWPHCAIFIIEDDAQSGADHVDAHRTTGFVVSPFIKRASVDHHFYNTNTFLRTMELLLNMPPMTQYDATATPIMDWTSKPENVEAYTPIMPERTYFAQRNVAATRPTRLPPVQGRVPATLEDLAAASDAMDFKHADAAPAEELNTIIWKLVRGVDSTPPARHGTADADDD